MSADPAADLWPGSDGSPIDCREKLRTLRENHAELAQTLRDCFDDAVLMGVDEAAMRQVLHAMVDALRDPPIRPQTGRVTGMRKKSLIGPAGASLLLCGALAVLCPRAEAQAQDAGSATIQGTPLAAPPNTDPSKVLGSGTTPAGPAEGQAATQTPPAPEPPPGTGNPSTPASSDWVQKTHADLILLDKIYGSSRRVTATVGTPFQNRFLTITVLACWVRPPTLPPDAAIFVQVTDSHAPAGAPPEFRGWVFQAEPALSGVSDATTDISVTGCN